MSLHLQALLSQRNTAIAENCPQPRGLRQERGMRPASLEERARERWAILPGSCPQAALPDRGQRPSESDTLKESDVLRTVPYGEQRSLPFSHSSEELIIWGVLFA